MESRNNTIIVVVVSVAVCSLFIAVCTIILIYFISSPTWRRSRIVQRKQYSRRRVLDELQHNVRYNSPDSLPVSLASVQPHTTRRQSLPAISLCPNLSTPLSLSPNYSGTHRPSYGSLELIRTKVRRFSEVGPPPSSNILAGSSERVRKISLDSQALSRICEESNDMYENSLKVTSHSQPVSTTSPPQNGSTSSLIDTELYYSTDDLSHVSGCGLGRLHFTISRTVQSTSATNSSTESANLLNLYISNDTNSSPTEAVTIRVHISRASYLRSALARETTAVYVKIALLPIELKISEQRTPMVTSMGNPLFNHTSTFHIPIGSLMALSNERPQLQLTVKEARKLESNKVIGYVWFDLTQIVKLDNENFLLTNPVNFDISREIFGENKLFRRRGDVLVHLKVANPTDYRHSFVEIEVHVAEARNLSTKGHHSSIYVRASLLVKHKVIQTKKGQIVKHGQSSPSFNDRFHFMVPLNNNSSSILNTTTPLSSLSNNSTSKNSPNETGYKTDDLNQISLEHDVSVLLCFCCRSGMMRASHLLGRCVLGGVAYTEGEGQLQWLEATIKRGVRVSQWLSLS